MRLRLAVAHGAASADMAFPTVTSLDVDDVCEADQIQQVADRTGRVPDDQAATSLALAPIAEDQRSEPGRVHEPDLVEIQDQGFPGPRHRVDLALHGGSGLEVHVADDAEDRAVPVVGGELKGDLV